MVQPQAVPLTMKIQFEPEAIEVNLWVGPQWRGHYMWRDVERMAQRVQESLEEMFQ